MPCSCRGEAFGGDGSRKWGETIFGVGIFQFQENFSHIISGFIFEQKKVQNLIAQQRTNLADVSNLDLNSINNIIQNFENPSISAKNPEKSSDDLKLSLSSDRKEAQKQIGSVIFRRCDFFRQSGLDDAGEMLYIPNY